MDGFAGGVAHYNEVKGKDVQVLGWDVKTQTGLFDPPATPRSRRAPARPTRTRSSPRVPTSSCPSPAAPPATP